MGKECLDAAYSEKGNYLFGEHLCESRGLSRPPTILAGVISAKHFCEQLHFFFPHPT